MAVAKRIVNGQEQQRPSENEHDWLGGGYYFWEDSRARALQWAQDHKKEGKLETPGVLGAIIDLGNCLNLIDTEYLELVKTAYKVYLDLCKESGFKPAENKGKGFRARYLDKAVFETLHKLRAQECQPPFDSVRAFFVEGEPLYESSGLHSLDHIQICVRSPRQIIGYFLPR